ncbi:hypothetical protein [Enemella sp. A6]|uniref:hypothetical protein n=1 Tax=Enemella sp. A6 TaxID=3440152 RepID=UPI003EBC2CAC
MATIEPLEIFGPQAYSSLWLIAGILAVLAFFAIPPVIVWLTRVRPPKPPPPPPPPDPNQFRAECLARINAIRQRHAAGQLGEREAHQELSQTVRAFVSDATGRPVDRMTLSDVQAVLADDPRFAHLADWIEMLYPPQFAPSVPRSVADSASEAERLVGSWN